MPPAKKTPEKILVYAPEKPIRVITEKSLFEKIGAFIWGLIKIGFILLFIGGIIAGSQFAPVSEGVQKTYFDEYFGNSTYDINAKEIAVIPVYGSIYDGASAMGGLQEISADDLIFLLAEAMNDPEIAAVLLRIDSPGGTALAAQKISTMIQTVQQQKPVFALLEGTAASGGYYIASVADTIYAYSGTLTGNIGVILQIPKIQELLNTLGIEMRTFATGEFKDIGSIFRDLKPEEAAILQTLLFESYEEFITTVANGRDMPLEQIRTLADGRIYSGTQAKENGLIDEIIVSFADTLEKIATQMGEKTLQPVLFELPSSPWEELLLQVKGGITGESLQTLQMLQQNIEQKNLRLLFE